MVNTEEFSKRLKIILNYYELSAATLAEKIEVQRSSISHILSGRNKPSLEFVLKVLKNFPEVELYWLLNGIGKFPKESVPPTLPKPKPAVVSESVQQLKMKQEHSSIESEEIDRIIIFFKDGTFKNYNS